MTNVTIAEGKKNFSRLISTSLETDEEILVTRHGRPVAVIIPYERYQRSRKAWGYKKILEAREAYLKTGIKAQDIYRESKQVLENRS